MPTFKLDFIPLLVLICCGSSIWVCPVSAGCPRDRSRLVRRVVHGTIKPLFEQVEMVMPQSCPLHEDRDMYYIHETHKTEESYSRYYCDFCGKSFYAEVFLDMHLENRHPEHIRTERNTVCLSDFCDLFRCEVIGGLVEPQYWDTALCIEDDMTDLHQRCQELMRSCIPRTAADNDSKQLEGSLVDAVCSALTCNKYWDTGQDNPTQWQMLLNTFLTVIMISGMIVYYFLAYHHFYSEPLYESSGPHYSRFPEYQRSNRPRRKSRHSSNIHRHLS